jgi:hypothetical protein
VLLKHKNKQALVDGKDNVAREHANQVGTRDKKKL